jgi:hypothetical protein
MIFAAGILIFYPAHQIKRIRIRAVSNSAGIDHTGICGRLPIIGYFFVSRYKQAFPDRLRVILVDLAA